MKVEHRTMTHGKCPVDGRIDYYEVIVETSRVVYVEDIETAVDLYRGTEQTQESMCQALYAEISSCKWTLVGRHGLHTNSTVSCGQ